MTMVMGKGLKEQLCGDWVFGSQLEWNHKERTNHQNPFSQQENRCIPAVVEVGFGKEGQRLGLGHRPHRDKAPLHLIPGVDQPVKKRVRRNKTKNTKMMHITEITKKIKNFIQNLTWSFPECTAPMWPGGPPN